MALLRKELRALRPFLWLVVIMAALDAASVLLTEFPDQHSIGEVFDNSDFTFSYLILFAIAFAIGQSTIGREKSEETLEFLDALPVSRARVYWTKWLAGYLVLTLYLLSGLAFHLPLHAWSLTSEDPSLYTEFWGAMLAMDLAVIAIYLSIGMALAFWGRFGLLAAIFYLIGIWILGDTEFPGADRLDPLIFGTLNVIGSALVVPWDTVLLQLAIAAVLAMLGQFAFDRLGRSRSEASVWQRFATPLFAVGLIAASIVWIVGGIATVFREGAPDPDAHAGEPTYVEWETTRHTSRDFTFIYPNNQAKAAESLIAESDSVHDTVLQFFGAESRRQLVVDLTSTSPRHAGSAYWGRIRINLQAEGLEASLPAVLGHELCHIYIDQLSDNRTSEIFDSTRFFHEGLASLVEYRFFRPADELNQIRRVAAAAHDRHDLRFEDLASSAALTRLYAPEWVYPLGEVFASAVVETWGDEAPAAIVRAFARKEAPKLAGIELWRDTFQAAGYDLETAIGAYFRLLDEIVAAERPWLDTLPQWRGRLTVDDENVSVTLSGGLPEKGKYFVRFRPGPNSAESDYRGSRVRENRVATLSRDHFPGGALDFQIVYEPGEPLMMPVFDVWVSAKIQ